jgi:hypothetical protein
MSDKQRADHVQAKYWNGYITRTEAQKVFGDFSAVINQHSVTLQKMDAVLSFLADKFGFTQQEIEAWVMKQVDEGGSEAGRKAGRCAS